MLMNAIMFLCAVLDIQILYTYFRGMFHQKKETISRIGVYAAFIGTEILLYLVTLFATDHNTVRKQYFDNLGINISL